jgi:hypothetical protein
LHKINNHQVPQPFPGRDLVELEGENRISLFAHFSNEYKGRYLNVII